MAIYTISKICLPSTKASKDTKIVSQRTLCKHPNKTLAIILYKLVTKLTSLKFEILMVWLFLGTRAMKVALVLWFITPLLWNSRNTLKVLFNHISALFIHCNSYPIKVRGLFLIQLENCKEYLLFKKGQSSQATLSLKMGDQSKPSTLQATPMGLESSFPKKFTLSSQIISMLLRITPSDSPKEHPSELNFIKP